MHTYMHENCFAVYDRPPSAPSRCHSPKRKNFSATKFTNRSRIIMVVSLMVVSISVASTPMPFMFQRSAASRLQCLCADCLLLSAPQHSFIHSFRDCVFLWLTFSQSHSMCTKYFVFLPPFFLLIFLWHYPKIYFNVFISVNSGGICVAL